MSESIDVSLTELEKQDPFKNKLKRFCLIILSIVVAVNGIAYLPLSIFVFLGINDFHDSYSLLIFSILTVIMGVFLIPAAIGMVLMIKKVLQNKYKKFKPVRTKEWSVLERFQVSSSNFIMIIALLTAITFFIISNIIFLVIIFVPESGYENDLLMVVFAPALLGWIAIIISYLLWVNARHNTFFISGVLAYLIPLNYRWFLGWSYEDFFTSYGFPVVLFEILLIVLAIIQLFHFVKNKNVSRETF